MSRNMKDSGVAYLGEIGSEFDVKPINSLFAIKKDIIGHEPDMVLSITQNGIKPKDIESNEGQIAASYANYQIVNVGDFAMNHMDLITGGVDISKYEGVTSPDYRVFVLKEKEMIDKFFLYVFQSYYKTRTFFGFGQGVANLGRWRLPANNFKNILIPITSAENQNKIVELLDEKCSEIDILIANQQNQIEKLKQYKQSLITEVVTKGLNPNVEMKDSEIEWIGNTPSKWNFIATKKLFKLESGATPKSEVAEYWDGNIKWITPADYKTEDKYVDCGRRNLTQEGYDACSTTLIPKNSIIFSKRAPIGAVVINREELCTNQGCLSCIPIRELCVGYYYYVMSVCTEIYNLLGSGTTFKEISSSSFGNFILPMPSIKEQIEISNYLNLKTDKINSLIEIKQQKIEKLNQYKKSIIYEYVTGKKEA